MDYFKLQLLLYHCICCCFIIILLISQVCHVYYLLIEYERTAILLDNNGKTTYNKFTELPALQDWDCNKISINLWQQGYKNIFSKTCENKQFFITNIRVSRWNIYSRFADKLCMNHKVCKFQQSVKFLPWFNFSPNITQFSIYTNIIGIDPFWTPD